MNPCLFVWILAGLRVKKRWTGVLGAVAGFAEVVPEPRSQCVKAWRTGLVSRKNGVERSALGRELQSLG